MAEAGNAKGAANVHIWVFVIEQLRSPVWYVVLCGGVFSSARVAVLLRNTG
jgi:hypothetical protein